MKITCLSDLHGFIPPDLSPGDLLILAGDYTGCDLECQYFDFFHWVNRQPFECKIMIGGNHDMRMEKEKYDGPNNGEFIFLNNSMHTYKGNTIWGTPHSLWFDGINPHCTAFTGSEQGLKLSYDQIPDNIDILISHGPPRNVLDYTKRGENVGSYSILDALDRVKPRLLVTGHIHESCGHLLYKHQGKNTLCVNASIMDCHYQPVNKPIIVEFKDGYVSLV